MTRVRLLVAHKYNNRVVRFKRANKGIIKSEERKGNFTILEVELPEDKYVELLGCKFAFDEDMPTLKFDGTVNPHM